MHVAANRSRPSGVWQSSHTSPRIEDAMFATTPVRRARQWLVSPREMSAQNTAGEGASWRTHGL
eukprot:5759391-Pyramimonas_sp.AAC.1